MRPCFILLFSNVHSRYLCVCGQSEAQELKKEVEEEAAQRELCEYQLEKLRMQVLGMRTSA